MFEIRNCLATCFIAGVLASAALLLVPMAEAAAESVVYSFKGPPDGFQPRAGLTNVNGILYGTTTVGGTNGNGTVFAVDPETGAERVVHSFCSTGNCTDGSSPQAGLLDVGGTLYGTTAHGGAVPHKACSCGTVFSLNPTTGAETVLHSFGGVRGGLFPAAGLINVDGTLYGTTAAGGGGSCNDGCGTVFSIDPTTGSQTEVYSFGGGTDGAEPVVRLLNVGGTLYGTTEGGGASGEGTVFEVNPATDAETVLHSFGRGMDGAGPTGGLIDVGGTLYGTTYEGGGSGCGGYGCGVVFEVNPTTGAETVVYSFCRRGGICADGIYPNAGVINVGGTLYGTTEGGGAHSCFGGNGCGTVFSLNPTTGAETVQHSFCNRADCTDGESSTAHLTNINGTLYGTTVGGGANNFGTVFKLTLP